MGDASERRRSPFTAKYSPYRLIRPDSAEGQKGLHGFRHVAPPLTRQKNSPPGKGISYFIVDQSVGLGYKA